jgi:Gram-negative porin
MKKLILLLGVITMVGAFAAVAMADVSLYGSARFRSYYASVDYGIPGADKDKDLEWRMGLLSRFGATFKSEKITGMFELDARAGSGASGTDPIESGDGASKLGAMRLRHLWGQWDFGAGKLMIGHNFPLYDVPVSGINYYSGGLQRWGGMGYGFGPRTSQIRLTFGDLRLAFLSTVTGMQWAPLGSFEEANIKYPKIEARYDIRKDTYALSFIGGWQTYEIEDRNGTKETRDITSYVLGARCKANIGPAYVNLGLTWRQNGLNYDAWTVSTKEQAVLQGNDVKDATAWGLVAALGWKINDMWTLEASHGTLNSKQDTSLDNEDDAMIWCLQVKITMAPNVYIYPELIYQDNKDVINNGVVTDQGDATILGVYWRIDFN